jgi:DNA-binding NarL/FixJ family response regulator
LNIRNLEPDATVRITVLRCPSPAPPYLIAVVLIRPPPDLSGLTWRELEVLGMLINGWPNQRIAGALFITPRTVAAHVDHIMCKLAASNRTLAAIRADRLGLYIPARLARRRHPTN